MLGSSRGFFMRGLTRLGKLQSQTEAFTMRCNTGANTSIQSFTDLVGIGSSSHDFAGIFRTMEITSYNDNESSTMSSHEHEESTTEETLISKFSRIFTIF